VTAIDDFFTHYYARRPVNATFTGVHAYDEELPDWSPRGLDALDDEIRSLGSALEKAYPAPASAAALRNNPDLLDAELARAYLEVQRAENASMHGPRGNPALWTGETIFSIIALMIREFAPLRDRIEVAEARLSKFSSSLNPSVGDPPTRAPRAWKEKALRDRDGAEILMTTGVITWLTSAELPVSQRDRFYRTAASAQARVRSFMAHVDGAQPDAPESAMSCGPDLFDLLLNRGHFCTRSRADLLTEAKNRFESARADLDTLARSVAGSWPDAQVQIAADHPTPDEYHSAFEKTWQACHEHAERANVVAWPDNWPIRYVSYPAWTADAAPHLYYLHYRSPAPFDPVGTYDYVVPALPTEPERAEQHLRVWNNSTIKLNHVVHHGAIGHHVQNWYAYNQQRSRAGNVAGVDCANRIGMFLGGTMTEGWACYATDLMEELGFLTPLERVSQQHTRVRMLARAIVDIELHQGTMSFADAVRFYEEQVGMSREAAKAEAVKNSMFPCTAIMYWLGTQGIHDLRDEMKRREGPRFSLRRFHGELLGYGSIPVPLVARMMTGSAPLSG
jgi:hypothetical protein